MLLILAVAVAGGVCLSDMYFLRPHVVGQRQAAMRDRAARAENTARWALQGEKGSLLSLCRSAAQNVGPEAFRDPAVLTRQGRTLGGGDAAWLCGADGRVVQVWRAGQVALSTETISTALSLTAAAGPKDGLPYPREPQLDSGLIDLGGEIAIYARGDIRGGQGAAPGGRLYLVRWLTSGLLGRLGSAIPAELTFVRADGLPGGTLADPSVPAESRSVRPLDNDRLAVAWPAKDVAGKMLGYYRASVSIARINDQAATTRKTVLIMLVLFGAVAILVILGAGILVANPITRLLRRVRQLEAGECLSEEFTSNLHAEPRVLAEQLQQVFQTMTHESKTDELTGLANRRQFDQALRRTCLEARRYNRHLSVMVIDVDLFKAVNDTAGHQAGDELLKVVAEIVQECCRNADLPARLGGDEFGVLLPETASAGAAIVAERIRTTMDGKVVSFGSSEITATVSIGIADCNAGKVREPHDLIDLADRALYAAKQAGRNRLAQAHDLVGPAWAEGSKESDRVSALRERLSALDSQFKGLFVRVLQEIVHALEIRDPHMANHARKVQYYALLIARRMYLPDPIVKSVELASLLHDIGMLALPDSVVMCPRKLSKEQWETMQRHPLLGARILAGMEFLEPIIPAVRSHHEYFDGMGYPDGLEGNAIPLAARIVAVADVFDAMTSPRSFRAAKSVPEALAELANVSGSQFAPDVVEAFLAMADSLGDKLTETPLLSLPDMSWPAPQENPAVEKAPVA